MKKLIIAILAVLMSAGAGYAASAKFKNVRIDSNIHHNGQRGVMIHADFDLDKAKGKIVECQAIFYAAPGSRALRDLNYKYRLSPSLNYVASSEYFTAASDAEVKDDCRIFIPTDELHLKNPRKYRIYVKVSVYTNPGKTGEFLTETDYIPFIVDNTGAETVAIDTYTYDPSMPPVPVVAPKAIAGKPADKKDKTVKSDVPQTVDPVINNDDEPQYDRKGRMKPRKRKVFIS